MLKGDFKIHSGGWGDHIAWEHPAEFDPGLDMDGEYSVHGHLPGRLPAVGDTLLEEFKLSWVQFVFVAVRRMTDPPDQFFGKVMVLQREEK